MKKERLFFVLMLVLVILISFAILEGGTRLLVGKRLITTVEDNGFYYFEPNQKGWYDVRTSVPKVNINNIGARGEDVDLAQEQKKYIFLGDSFMFGWLLKDEETLPHQFMQVSTLSQNEVINYGNGGFGIEHMIESYRKNRQYFSAQDEVIMMMIPSDFYRPLQPEKKSWVKDLFWSVKKRSSFVAWTWAKVRIATAHQALEKEEEKEPEIFEEWGETLQAFAEEVESDGRSLTYVFFEYEESEYSELAKAFCKKEKVACITNVFEYVDKAREENMPIYTIDQGHPSPEVNYELAIGLQEFFDVKSL